MPIRIAFVNGKGGVGKTTASTLIAAALHDAGQMVSIDDRDPQLSATTAANVFNLPLGDDQPVVIIDTAPSVSLPSTLDAIKTADLVVLVTSPSPLDLATTVATAQWINAERPTGETRLLFNLVQTNNRFFNEMTEIAREMPFPTLKHYLLRLTAFQVAQIGGWKSMPAKARQLVIEAALEIATVAIGNHAKQQTVRH